MPRTAAVAALPAVVILWNWLRLERAPRGLGEALLVTVLALLPALVPGRLRRALAVAGAALVALPVVALDQGLDRRLHFVAPAFRRFGDGVGRFYDVTVPFAPTEHAMHGVILVAIFGFTLATGLAVAAQRPALAAATLLVGAGWPATLLAGSELLRGAGILLAALALLAGLRGGRAHTRPALAAGLVLVLAVAASTSSAVARGGIVDWQHWRLGAPAPAPVSVRYVWDADYSGLHWPKKTTDVLRVQGPARPLYWRATTLDGFADGRWYDEGAAIRSPGADPLLPSRSASNDLVYLRVKVLGLADTHLPAAASPVGYDVPLPVAYTRGGVANVPGLERGLRYAVRSYAPSPTPAQLAAAGGDYPDAVGPYLEVAGGATAPLFGAAGRGASVEALLRQDPTYRPLYRQAARIAGGAPSPYAAAVAVETWLRSGGGFVYDEQPPAAGAAPALVEFVTRTKRGYCQHFAGAMALMLRYLGVPARVAVGFTSGTYDAAKGSWTVTDRDAHAWVEVWFPRWGWLPFDPTPGRGNLGGAYTSSSRSFDGSGAAAAVGSSSPVANALAQRAKANPRLEGEQPVPSSGAAARPSSSRRPVLALLAGLAVLALVAAAAVKRTVRRLRLRRAPGPRAFAAAGRRELTAFAGDQGVTLPTTATLAELVPLVERAFGVDARGFAAAATEAAYAPPERAAEAVARVRRELRSLLHALGSSLPLRRRLRGALSLRSL